MSLRSDNEGGMSCTSGSLERRNDRIKRFWQKKHNSRTTQKKVRYGCR